MMYPETFVDDKGVLDAYQTEYGNYYQEAAGFQRIFCIKETAQFCPKCDCYHKSNPAKRCVCLTVTSLLACVCFLLLTLSVTFHVEDLQTGYETVHHFLILITSESNEPVQAPEVFETQNTSTESDVLPSTESPETTGLYVTNENVEDYLDSIVDEDNYYYSGSERKKRSLESTNVQYNENSSIDISDCLSILSSHPNHTSNSSVESKGGDEYFKRYEYCENVVRNKTNKTDRGNISVSNQKFENSKAANKEIQTPILHTALTDEEYSLEAQDFDKSKDKYSEKRSYGDYYTPYQYIYSESDVSNQNLHEDPDIVPINRASEQNIPYIPSSARTRQPYPPTGPDGSNYGESVKTSQQLTVANNQIWKRVCFRAQNNPNPQSLICVPMISRQFESNQGLQNAYSIGDPLTKDRQQKGFDYSLPNMITPNAVASDLNSDPNRQQFMIPPTSSPDIHIPTAISSPNPYYFPTLNGAPIMSNLPYDSRQIPPYWHYRGSPSSPFYGSSRFPAGFTGYQPSQSQFQMLPPKSPADLLNPVICMYVQSRSHQFPVVNGVTEVNNRNVDGSHNTRQSQPVISNSSSHQTFKSANSDCGDNEFACKHSDSCVLSYKWCDGQVDCSDASDETDCSCKHRLDKQRLCDGYFDCPSGEDELGCFGCDRDSFSCQDWERGREQSTCVPLSKMCDNVVDCINHRDELECSLLSESIVPHKTHFVSFTKGILHHNWKGRWYPACTGPRVTEWAIQACLADAGTLTEDPHIEMTSTEYPGPYIIPNGLEGLKLSQMCRDQKVVTYVTCPSVECGTRVTRPMLDSSVRARNAYQRRSQMQWRTADTYKPSDEYSEDPLKEDKHVDQELGYCENCGSIASKSQEYRTQFEPEEQYHRWTRDADDILGVVGGRKSRPSSWPWLIALYRNGRFHCGGVIVNELWVLTAAHCLDQFQKHYFEVQAGMLRRFSFSPQEQTRRVSHVVLHNLYDKFDMQNDLALLRLHSKLKYNRWVRPICLPQEHISQYGPPPGSLCTAVGWGATKEGGADPDDLHEVNVPILPYCKHRTDQEGAGLCAGYLHGGHDACQGDSGGPLLCKLVGDEDHWYVAGVVSHGEGCARPDEPGVYTRVFLFLDWIKSTISDQGSLTPTQMPRQDCPGMQCNSGRRCIPLSQLCDTKANCLNAEDETFCNENYLESTNNETNYSEDYGTVTDTLDTSNEDQINIHGVSREKNHDSEQTFFKSSQPVEPKTTNEGNVQILAKVEDPQLSSIGNDNRNDELVEITTTKENPIQAENNHRDTITIHEVFRRPHENMDSQNDKKHTHDTNSQEETFFESSNPGLESKSILKPANEEVRPVLPKTKGPMHLLSSKEVEQYESGASFGWTDNNDQNIELNYTDTHESVFPYSHESILETTDEENCPSLNPNVSVKGDEDNVTDTSTLETETVATTTSFTSMTATSTAPPPDSDLESTTLNIYHNEDTQLINELVHLYNNMSETEDDSGDFYNVNIPSYIVPILFANETHHNKDHSAEEHNPTPNTVDNIPISTYNRNEQFDGTHASENNNSTDINLKEHEQRFGETSTFNPYKQENDENVITVSTLSPLIDDIETTTLVTTTTTLKEISSDSALSLDRLKNGGSIKENKNNHETSSISEETKIKMNETEDYESFCKTFMYPKEPLTKNINSTYEIRTNTSDSDKHMHTHENITDYSIKPTDLANSTKKMQKVKRNSFFRCKKYKQPLLKRRRCDGIIDCEDGSDEAKCLCRDRLMQFDPSLICDGRVDCYDQTDEKHCTSNCNKTAFYCPKSKICISRAHLCDGVRNCPENEDEENCYALTSNDQIRLDRALLPEFTPEGIVVVNSVIGWKPLCVTLKSGHSAAIRACHAQGFKGYEAFEAEDVRNESTRLQSPTMCSGLRVKCSPAKADRYWVGWLLVEGEFVASIAMVHPQWLLLHSSFCKQFNLESQYVEVSFGQNQLSKFGIRGVYEESRRVDGISMFDAFCLLHSETAFSLSRQVRPMKILPLDGNHLPHGFYAVTSSTRGFYKLQLNESQISRGDDSLCFTVTHRPSDCYKSGGFSENGFVVMNAVYESFVASTFDSIKIFCDTMSDVCLEKLSTFSSAITGAFDKQPESSKASPPCNGIRCGKCVKWEDVSNGEPDCSDLSDESPESFIKRQKACKNNPSVCGCRVDQLKCPSGLCIDKSSYCDGNRDCDDGSDEPPSCRDNCFTYLQFAYPQKICDGVRNCFDKSDEKWETCHSKTCLLQDAFVCKSGGRCIPAEFVCDDQDDCPDGEDEQNCVSLLHSKLNEGALSQQRFGEWSPKCVNSSTVTAPDFTSVCVRMGLSEAVVREVITPNRTTLAADSFNPVSLNSLTTIVMRKGRPLLEVDSSSPCKNLYIKCL